MLALLFVVGLVVSSRVLDVIILLLLSIGVLAVINTNSFRDKLVEYIGPVFLIELILDVLL